MVVLLPILVAFLACWQEVECVYNMTELVIRPVSFTHRGAIGAGMVCPPKSVAVGFKMKMQLPVEAPSEGDDARNDYSSLNGVRLVCTDGSEAKSAEGIRGEWTENLKCQGKTDFIVGVRIKSEPWQGWDVDDVGATNFEGVCRSGARLVHRATTRSKNTRWSNRGEWGPVAKCPEKAPAVCGIKSRIDGPVGGRRGKYRARSNNRLVHQVPDQRGDSAGLTEVQLKCCRI